MSKNAATTAQQDSFADPKQFIEMLIAEHHELLSNQMFLRNRKEKGEQAKKIHDISLILNAFAMTGTSMPAFVAPDPAKYFRNWYDRAIHPMNEDTADQPKSKS